MSSRLCDHCKSDQRVDKTPKRGVAEVGITETKDLDSLFLASGSLLDLLQRPDCSFCQLVLRHYTGIHGDSSTWKEAELLKWTYDIILSKHDIHIEWWENDSHFGSGGTISFWPYIAHGNSIEELLGNEQIDVEDLIRRINYCQTQHGQCQRQLRIHGNVYPRRVIDVKSWSLVTLTGPLKYCALSYVWGDVRMFKATLANVHSLEGFGGLKRQKFDIPLVIEDAAHLTSALGCQYLWVDALCILQDDPTELAEEISRMGSIYSGAFVTFAAASGNDANSCLPGLRPKSRLQPRSLEYINGNFVVSQPPYDLFGNIYGTKYESRAWTYQETCLSTRCLYFCKDTFFLRCLEYVSLELEPRSPPGSDPMDLYYDRLGTYLMRPLECSISQSHLQHQHGAKKACRRYHDLLEPYLLRTATYSSDVLRAFEGILSRLNEQGFGIAIAGIPESIFHFGILWTASDSIPRHGFPSWSWASRENANDLRHNPDLFFYEAEAHFEELVNNYTLIDGSACYSVQSWDSTVYKDKSSTWPGIESRESPKLDMSSPRKLQLVFSAYAVGEATFWFEEQPKGFSRDCLVELNDYGGAIFGHVIFDDLPQLSLSEGSERKLIALSRQNYPAKKLDGIPQSGYWMFSVMLVITWGGISRRLGIGQVPEEAWQKLLPICEKFVVE